jgi:hypothetical protein
MQQAFLQTDFRTGCKILEFIISIADENIFIVMQSSRRPK